MILEGGGSRAVGFVKSKKVVKDGTAVTYTNNKEGVVPTAVPHSNWIMLLLIGFGAGVIAILLLKRRYKYENES